MTSTNEAPPAPRSLDDWRAIVAAGALVAGGFLVSIAGPMLRAIVEQRGRELVELRAIVAASTLPAEVAHEDELAGDGAELVELDDPADPGPLPARDIWGAAVNGAEPATDELGAIPADG